MTLLGRGQYVRVLGDRTDPDPRRDPTSVCVGEILLVHVLLEDGLGCDAEAPPRVEMDSTHE